MLKTREELVAKYAPECTGPEAKFRPFFGDPEVDQSIYKDQGYKAVMDKDKQVNDKGDPLYKIKT